MTRTRRPALSLLRAAPVLAASLPAWAQPAPPEAPPSEQDPAPSLESAPRPRSPDISAPEPAPAAAPPSRVVLPGPNPLPQAVAPAAAPAAPAKESSASGRSASSDRPPGPGDDRFASPQDFALEIRLGPYRPAIDEGVEGTPFADFFGSGDRYLFGLELDWQVARIPFLGTLGAGAGWSYTRRSGPNQPVEEIVEDAGAPVDQDSQLALMPMHAVGVLRIDAPARAWSVPVVPYGKLGLGYTLWWVNDGRGIATSELGERGKGASTGSFFALGAMLLLDVFDPSSARQLDADTGINNTYAFVEWARSKVGGGQQMSVGSSDWVAGLALEF